MMTRVMMKATTMIANRVEQRRLDLRFDAGIVFLVGCSRSREVFENPGLLARRNEVAVQGVEVKRVLPERRASEEPVSTSVLIPISNLATAGLAWPLPTMSKD